MDPHPTYASVCVQIKIFPLYTCGVTSSDPGLKYVSSVFSSGYKWINLSLISVPLCLFFQTYRLKEKTGLMGVISSFWTKINQPFQPGVPEPQDPRTRVLSQPFSRDKLHLWVPALADSQTIIKAHLQMVNPHIGLIVFLLFCRFDIKSKNSLFSNAIRGRIVSIEPRNENYGIYSPLCHSKHTKETFWMIHFSPCTVTRIGDWSFQASKMTEKHQKKYHKTIPIVPYNSRQKCIWVNSRIIYSDQFCGLIYWKEQTVHELDIC